VISWRLAAASLAALAFAAPATAAGVRISGIDVGAYPDVRVTVLAPVGSTHPWVTENGAQVTGAQTLNLGRAKSVVLAVDRSASMRGSALSNAAGAARAFVAAKGSADRIEVIAFGHKALALTRFSSATLDADVALRKLVADHTSGTALWDAVVLAAQRLEGEDQPGHVIIVVTDGHDVSSSATFADAVAAAHRARASVYPIGIAGKDFTPDALRDLAAQTGGSYHEASSSAELDSVYASISRTLARTWEVRYPTAARPGDALTLVASIPGIGASERTVEVSALGVAGAAPSAPSKVLPTSAWSSPLAPVVVTLLVGILVLLACSFWIAARSGVWLRARLDPHLAPAVQPGRKTRRPTPRLAFKGLFTATDEAFANFDRFRALQQILERADFPLLAAELLYVCVGTALVAGLFAAVAGGPTGSILILMAIGGIAPLLFVNFKAKKRIKAFDNQLPDLLITIAASLKAGHSFRHALQAVVDEGAQPAAKEFTRVLTETRLGRPMDDALAEMSERVGSKNLGFVITAVTIQRQIGGSLAGLFDMVAETVRERQQFVRKIRGLTAMGRMSAYVLIGLPFFVAFAVTLINPQYMAPLYHTSTGHTLIAVGLVMMGLGTVLLKKIVSFAG
jgi:tight adherence protein B